MRKTDVKPSQFNTAIDIAKGLTYQHHTQLLLHQQGKAEHQQMRRLQYAEEDRREVRGAGAQQMEDKIVAIATEIDKKEQAAKATHLEASEIRDFERQEKAAAASRRQELARERREKQDEKRRQAVMSEQKRKEKMVQRKVNAVEAKRLAIFNERFEEHQEVRRQLGKESRAFWFKKCQDFKNPHITQKQEVKPYASKRRPHSAMSTITSGGGSVGNEEESHLHRRPSSSLHEQTDGAPPDLSAIGNVTNTTSVLLNHTNSEAPSPQPSGVKFDLAKRDDTSGGFNTTGSSSAFAPSPSLHKVPTLSKSTSSTHHHQQPQGQTPPLSHLGTTTNSHHQQHPSLNASLDQFGEGSSSAVHLALHQAELAYLEKKKADDSHQRQIANRTAAMKVQIREGAKLKRQAVAKGWVKWDGAPPPFVAPKPVKAYGRKLTEQEEVQQREYEGFVNRQARLYDQKKATTAEQRQQMERADKRRNEAVLRAEEQRQMSSFEIGDKTRKSTTRAAEAYERAREYSQHHMETKWSQKQDKLSAARDVRDLSKEALVDASMVKQQVVVDHQNVSTRRQQERIATKEDDRLVSMQGAVSRLAAKML